MPCSFCLQGKIGQPLREPGHQQNDTFATLHDTASPVRSGAEPRASAANAFCALVFWKCIS